jgi:hypothetical protein
MAGLANFLKSLLEKGEIHFTDRPDLSTGPQAGALDLLHRTFLDYRLEIAGSLIVFDPDCALAAARLVRAAAWFLVNHDEPESELHRHLTWTTGPTQPAQHLSADLVLRYLPQIHRRAQALAAADLLPTLLADILRRWPLSGVLANIEEEPLTSLEMGGHLGLMMLYAERLARHEKPAWFPTGGQALDYVELIFGQWGKQHSVQLYRQSNLRAQELQTDRVANGGE